MSNTVDKVKVLDFGGGLGFSYIATAAGVADPQNIEFHVVETRNICRIGAALFEGDPRITFHDVLPSDVQNVSIVHLGSSLHYIDEWQKLISDLIRYKPAYIIFTDLPAGDIQTFVTAQNYYESKIPVWFYNINDILAEMGKHRFRLIFKSRYKGTYFGQIQEVPQDNFPQSMRIGDTCVLIFSGLCAEVHD